MLVESVPWCHVLRCSSGSWCRKGSVFDSAWVTCDGKGRRTDRCSACDHADLNNSRCRLGRHVWRRTCSSGGRSRLFSFFLPANPLGRAPTKQLAVSHMYSAVYRPATRTECLTPTVPSGVRGRHLRHCSVLVAYRGSKPSQSSENSGS